MESLQRKADGASDAAPPAEPPPIIARILRGCASCGGGKVDEDERLSLSQPGEPLEQEADRVAARVMRQAVGAPPALRAFRQQDDEALVVRAASASGAGEGAASLVNEALRSPGRPLDAQTRSFMEPRIGRDFGDVQVHTGDRASRSAEAVSALAYTVGHHVVFRSGQYAPETASGARLLAHELTHVAQQTPAAPLQRAPAPGEAGDAADLAISHPHDHHEVEADRFADGFVRGARGAVAPVAAGSVARATLQRAPLFPGPGPFPTPQTPSAPAPGTGPSTAPGAPGTGPSPAPPPAARPPGSIPLGSLRLFPRKVWPLFNWRVSESTSLFKEPIRAVVKGIPFDINARVGGSVGANVRATLGPGSLTGRYVMAPTNPLDVAHGNYRGGGTVVVPNDFTANIDMSSNVSGTINPTHGPNFKVRLEGDMHAMLTASATLPLSAHADFFVIADKLYMVSTFKLDPEFRLKARLSTGIQLVISMNTGAEAPPKDKGPGHTPDYPKPPSTPPGWKWPVPTYAPTPQKPLLPDWKKPPSSPGHSGGYWSKAWGKRWSLLNEAWGHKWHVSGAFVQVIAGDPKGGPITAEPFVVFGQPAIPANQMITDLMKTANMSAVEDKDDKRPADPGTTPDSGATPEPGGKCADASRQCESAIVRTKNLLQGEIEWTRDELDKDPKNKQYLADLKARDRNLVGMEADVDQLESDYTVEEKLCRSKVAEEQDRAYDKLIDIKQQAEDDYAIIVNAYPRPVDPCGDDVPVHPCSELGYPAMDLAAWRARIKAENPGARTLGTQGSDSGDCFKDGNPRGEEEARAHGATHTTYYKANGEKIGSVVCCKCCEQDPDSMVPNFTQRCDLV